jgi:hypothetical protein
VSTVFGPPRPKPPTLPQWKSLAALVKTDPPTPRETIVLSRWIPEQYLRQLGVGGWAEDPHARAKATTRWEGTPLHRVTLDIHLDAVRRFTASGARDIETECATLHRWGLPVTPGDPLSEPPKIQIRWSYGQQLRWVIQDIAWNRLVLDPDSGRRIQADVTVDLLEHHAAVLALSPVEQAQARPWVSQRPAGTEGGAAEPGNFERPGARRLYTVRAGDTLSSIAARELGSAGRWPEIYALNSPPASQTLLNGPDLIVPGQVLTLPAQ